MWFKCFFITFSAFLFQPLEFKEIHDLGGKWKLRDINNTYILQATVPGGIYTDLMNGKIIDDVFYGDHDQTTRWVSKTDWIYTKTFYVTNSLLAHENINLVLDGIDTFASIYLNDKFIGETENMFVRYIFNVKSYLQEGANNITAAFESPVNKAEELYEEQKSSYIVPPICVPFYYNGECHVNHIRKMQASFAWDWGPAFPSVGIWKPIYLEAYNSTLIRDVTVFSKSNEGKNTWEIQTTTYFAENSVKDTLEGNLIIAITTEADVLQDIVTVNLSTKGDNISVTHQMSVPKVYVNLWWPNGYGESKLYHLNITFVNADESETSVKSARIGFRTIDLVQNPIPGNGLTFYFKVNNVPMFMKGSNSIPVNILPELGQNETYIRYLLQSAKEVNMNMLRVWGGGVYESDAFYDIADELGILIWQDFMFACSLYPSSDSFIKNVKKEVQHQVRRLQHHPSIAIWAGNNENEVALRDNWYGTASNFDLYKQDYIKLYVDTIEHVCLASDRSRLYLTSSPTNGKQSIKEGYIAEDPYSNLYGDTHYYNYISDGWSALIYPRTKFASEYGYQSLPSLNSWLTATGNKTDLDPTSNFMIHRQHHGEGYLEMEFLISKQLKLPSPDSDTYIDTFIFYSQIIQAMAVKIETENYRRMRSILFDNGEGLTMGALYWQLNSVWVAPDWSSIDFKGRWKMLHYFAKDFFAPVIVTGYLSFNDLKVYAVSDKVISIYNATVNIEVYNWWSFTPVKQQAVVTDVKAGTSALVTSVMLTEFFPEKGCGDSNSSLLNCFVYLTITDEQSSLGPNNYVFPVALKKANISIPQLKITSIELKSSNGNEFKITVTADRISLFVWLETGDIHGRFSENGFLQISPIKTVYFYSETVLTVKELEKAITVTNLLDKKYL